MIAIKNELAQLVRTTRRRMGLTQKELADLAGVPYSALANLESGDARRGYPKLLDALADTLGLDRDELYTLAGRVPDDLIDQIHAAAQRDTAVLRRIRKAIR